MVYTSLQQKFEKGRYKGKTLGLIMKSNPDYIQWCIQSMNDFSLSEELMSKLNKRKSIIEFSDVLVNVNAQKKYWGLRTSNFQLNMFVGSN
ncbi:MAG: hypothetical protein ACK45U_00700 [bacterium]|jgi:spore coat polysaccharide biosynthesis protein SpsF (cytidylyltransferase family)